MIEKAEIKQYFFNFNKFKQLKQRISKKIQWRYELDDDTFYIIIEFKI